MGLKNQLPCLPPSFTPDCAQCAGGRCSQWQPHLPITSEEGTVPSAMQQLAVLGWAVANRDGTIHQATAMPNVAGKGSEVKYKRRNSQGTTSAGLT